MTRETVLVALLAGLALLLAAAFASGRRAGAWFGLAAACQAALLWLYDAGPWVTYQHVHLGARWSEEPAATGVALGVLGAALVLVLAGLWVRRVAVKAWLAEQAHPLGWLALLVLFLGVAAKLRQPPLESAIEFVLVALVHLITLGAVALGAALLEGNRLERARRRLDAWLGPEASDTTEPGPPDAFAWRVALASALAAACLAWFVYERHPHVPDEVVYLLHARYLAEGLLWLPAPPVPAGFDIDLMLVENGRWYCPVNPGWPAVLALFSLVRAEWLANPLLGGISILVVDALFRELLPRRSARIATLLLATSPWFLFLNMSLMTHTWSLLCAALGALGVARARRTGQSLWTWIGGAGVGMVATIRPLDGLVLAACLGLWAIGVGGKRVKLAALAGLVLGTAAVSALVLPYNAALTGSATLFPINHYVDLVYGPGKNRLGFGPEKGLGWGGLDPWPGHTPFQALVNAQFNLFAIDVELFGWGVGSLFLVGLAFFARRRLASIDRALAVFVVAVILSNSLYWFSGGPDFGARYWYLVIVPLVVLAVRGVQALASRPGARTQVEVVIAALVLGNLALFVPWRALDKYAGYRDLRPDVRELAAEHGFGRSLVLVRGQRHPDFDSAVTNNPLDWEANAPIYAWDRDSQVRRALLEHYRDRPVWILEGPSLTGDGSFRVHSGPQPASELLDLPMEGR